MIFRSLEALPSVREKLASSSVLIPDSELLVQVRLLRRLKDVFEIERVPPLFSKLPPRAKVPEETESVQLLRMEVPLMATLPAVEVPSPALMLIPCLNSRSAFPVLKPSFASLISRRF